MFNAFGCVQKTADTNIYQNINDEKVILGP